jgi:hypothetical protein
MSLSVTSSIVTTFGHLLFHERGVQVRAAGGVEGEITGPHAMIVWLKCPSLKRCHCESFNGCRESVGGVTCVT